MWARIFLYFSPKFVNEKHDRMSSSNSTVTSSSTTPDMRLFWGCFIALIATSFGFIARVLTASEWGAELGLSETQKGEILGVGFWPFAISIVLFSLVIDKIGYKVAMWFGLACHILSTIILVTAKGYTGMYLGTLILALGSGTVEAYINPVVATKFSFNKTKWLNILHAGWPGGMVLGGIIIILLASGLDWRTQMGIILIPTVIYAVILWNKQFPVHERVSAGVTFNEMLKEVGLIGGLIVFTMVILEIGRLFAFPQALTWALILGSSLLFGSAAKWSLGQPLYIFLLLIMMILATTELGVDSWVTDLMAGEMQKMGLNPGWLLLYTSAIMMVLRFLAGPIVHSLKPLGLLAVCAAIAAIGLIFLSKASGGAILVAATLYGIGKTFFWPTTLGVVSEQFPRGGALTLNAIAGVGMLAVGTVGNPFMGYVQDRQVNKEVIAYDQSNNTQLHDTYSGEKRGIFGKYESIDPVKLATAEEKDKAPILNIQEGAKKSALSTIAIFPIIMFVCYILLILYFRSKGGYKPVELGGGEH